MEYAGTTLVLSGVSTITGPTDIDSGTFQVDGSQPSSAVTLNSQYTPLATLSGTGTVGPVTATNAVISPGDSPTVTGILTVEGSVTLGSQPSYVVPSGSSFVVALNGATAGSGYDQLNATGAVNLGGSTLDATLGFTPAAGETFTIIKSSAPIVGTFKGRPEGASITIGGVPFTINYAGGTSGDDVVLTAGAATTVSTTTTLSSSANPAIDGQAVTFTAIVTPTSGTGTPAGTVTFTIDGQAEAPAALAVVNGVDEATFTTTSLPAGPHTISAAYSGAPAFASSSVPTPLTQTINAPPLQATTTSLSASPNPSTFAQSVTFTAVVAPTGAASSPPSGTVTFTIDGQPKPPVDLAVVDGVDQAVFSTATLAVGPHTISAAYSGDPAFASSSLPSPLTQTINAPPLAATSMQLTSSANPSTFGQSVTFTALVCCGTGTSTPTGTVTFTIDGKAGPPIPLAEVNGKMQATFTTSSMTPGTCTIVAAYSGDLHFAPSQSSAQSQEVNAGDGPTIVSMLRFGYHMMPTTLVLTFDEALAAVTAEDTQDYRIIGPAGRVIGIKSAVYDPENLTVTLHPQQRINLHYNYELVVDGIAPDGLTNTQGQLLDGADNGKPGSDYRAPLTWRNLVLDPPLPKAPHPTRTRTGSLNVKSAPAHAASQ